MNKNALILILTSVIGPLTGWAVIVRLMRAEHHPAASVIGVIVALIVAVLWETLLELLDQKREGAQTRFFWVIRVLRMAIVLLVLETIVGASDMVGEAAEEYLLIRQFEFSHIGGFYSAPHLPLYVGRMIALSLAWAILPGLVIIAFMSSSPSRYSKRAALLTALGVFTYWSVNTNRECVSLLLASITSWCVAGALSWIVRRVRLSHNSIPLVAVTCALLSAVLGTAYSARSLTHRIASMEERDLETIVTHYYRFVDPMMKSSFGRRSLDERMVSIKELPISEQLLAANKEYATSAALFNQFMEVQGPMVCRDACGYLTSELQAQRNDHHSQIGSLMLPIFAGCLSFWIFPGMMNLWRHKSIALHLPLSRPTHNSPPITP